MRIAGLSAALLITLLGVFGAAAPGPFFELVAAIQEPSLLYLAAAIRVAVGLSLLLAAKHARWPWLLRVPGALILVGGLLTPFFGARIAQVLLALWSTSGPGMVRAWGLVAATLGLLLVFSLLSRPAPRT